MSVIVMTTTRVMSVTATAVAIAMSAAATMAKGAIAIANSFYYFCQNNTITKASVTCMSPVSLLRA